MPKKKYLKFVEVKTEKTPPPKTKKYAIFNHETNDYLGTIHWKNTWRQYVFDDEILELAEGCLEELATFIKMLREDRTTNKQNGK